MAGPSPISGADAVEHASSHMDPPRVRSTGPAGDEASPGTESPTGTVRSAEGRLPELSEQFLGAGNAAQLLAYTVKAGDTLTRIAKAFGMPLAELAKANPQISDLNMIFVGQTVNVPVTPTGPNALPPGTTADDVFHTVERGDTMSDIARDNKVTLQQLLAANPQVVNPNLILVGQKIRLPHAAAQPEPDEEPQADEQPPTGDTAGTSGVVAADHTTPQGGVSYRFEGNPPRGTAPGSELLAAIADNRGAAAAAVDGLFAWRHFGESNYHGHPEGAAVDFGLNPADRVGVEPSADRRLVGEAFAAWAVTHTGPDLPFRQVIFRNGDSITAGHHDHVHVNYNLSYRGALPVPPTDIVERYLAGEYGPRL